MAEDLTQQISINMLRPSQQLTIRSERTSFTFPLNSQQ
jgi:hypothetical protein